jgi:hypothetical protein
MPYVSRDPDTDAVNGLYANLQPGLAEEFLADEHADIVEFYLNQRKAERQAELVVIRERIRNTGISIVGFGQICSDRGVLGAAAAILAAHLADPTTYPWDTGFQYPGAGEAVVHDFPTAGDAAFALLPACALVVEVENNFLTLAGSINAAAALAAVNAIDLEAGWPYGAD